MPTGHGREWEADMTAILLAFFAFGFFAAGLVGVLWLVAITSTAAAATLLIGALQSMGLLRALGLAVAVFALAQVGYGLGLFRVSMLRKRPIPD
jgi:hypothetical protein